MKQIKKWKIDIINKRYSAILVLSYIFLSILSIAFLFIIMFGWFNKYLKKEIYDMSIVQLSNTSQVVNNQFDFYRTILQNMFQEPNTKKSLYSEQYNPLNEWDISRYLNYTLSNDGCIDYSAIYQNGKIKQIVGRVYPNEEEQQKLIDSLNNSYGKKDIFYIKNNSDFQNRLFLVRMESDVFGEAPQRGVIFAINQTKLSNKLLSNTDEKHGYYVFDSKGNQVLDQGAFKEELLKGIWNDIKNNKSEGFEDKVEVEGDTYFIVAIYDPAYDLQFIQLMNISAINTTLNEVLKRALISLVVIIILCSILALIMTYFIYKPLNQFFKKLISYTNIAENSKEYSDELGQITSDKIISQVSSISRHFRVDKVLGYLEGVSSTLSTLPSTLRISENNENIILIYAKNKIEHITQQQYTTLFMYIKESLVDISSVEMFPEKIRGYCLFILKDKKKERSILKERESLLNRLRNDLECTKARVKDTYLIFSKLIEGEEELQTSFSFIQDISKYVLFDNCELICDSNNFLEKLKDDIPKKRFEQVFDIVRSGNEVEAKLQTINLLKLVEKYEVSKIFHALSYFATELEVINSQVSLKSKEYQELYMGHYTDLANLMNQKQLYGYLNSIIEEACRGVQAAQEGSLKTNMISSIEYINEHYQDPSLSLEQVADLFHISTSYFSKMFNGICNTEFPKYVNELRLNHSAALLRNTRLNIKDISAQSGFSNASYFSAQFKKKYVVSPSTYRNNYVKK